MLQPLLYESICKPCCGGSIAQCSTNFHPQVSWSQLDTCQSKAYTPWAGRQTREPRQPQTSQYKSGNPAGQQATGQGLVMAWSFGTGGCLP
eukprot:377469-Pelagomonas_calceolata.AAC.3